MSKKEKIKHTDLRPLKQLKTLTDNLKTTNSTSQKVQMIERFASFQSVKNLLTLTYSPYIHFGVSSKNCKKLSNLVAEESYDTIFNLLDELNARVITGHDAIEMTNGFAAKIEDSELKELFWNIIDKDLKTRTAASLINKAIPGLIPKFKVALAETFKTHPDYENEEWLISRKLDGVRCVIRKENGNVKAYSRNGKEFETLQKVLDNVKKIPGEFVLDGELCITDDDGNEDFQNVMKEIRRKNHTIKNPKFFIFDCLSLKEFDSCTSTTTLSERLENIADDLIPGPDQVHYEYLTLLEQFTAHDKKHVEEQTKVAEDSGHEGIMLRKDTTYQGKRSKDILKVKKFHDAEYKVMGATNGDIRVIEDGVEKTINCLSSIMIKHKGTQVGVGSGFSIDQRKEFGKDHSKILGKTITVQYFEESQNQDGEYSLRFPVLKYIYDEKRNC